MIKAKRNMSDFDRIIRFVVALLLLSIVFIGKIGGFLAIVLIIVSIPFLIASITAHCPFYKSTNLSTYTHEDFEDFNDTKHNDSL